MQEDRVLQGIDGATQNFDHITSLYPPTATGCTAYLDHLGRAAPKNVTAQSEALFIFHVLIQ